MNSPSDVPGVLRPEDLAEACKTLDDAALVVRFAPAFLVHYGSAERMQRPEVAQPTRILTVETPLIAGSPLGAVKDEYLIYPVASSGRSPYPSRVTVGRTKNNDIILPDDSVSKFHAFFKESSDAADGGEMRLLLQDAGSRNGTLMDGVPVPSNRHGTPVLVQTGARLTFGRVELTFLDVAGLRELVRVMTRMA